VQILTIVLSAVSIWSTVHAYRLLKGASGDFSSIANNWAAKPV
jgi:hypothetical protein